MKIDKTGRRYGRLLVLSPSHFVRAQRYWLCRCDCGTEKTVQGGNLASGHVQSCGCLNKQTKNKTHGQSRGYEGNKDKATPTYRTWIAMKQRCLNPQASGWDKYGGRGIKVCVRWQHSFDNFLADLGKRPNGCSIERINNDGNYEPGNVRWATATEQQMNRRTARLVTFNGKQMNVTKAAEAAGISRNLVFKRLDAGWPEDRALTTPPRIIHQRR